MNISMSFAYIFDSSTYFDGKVMHLHMNSRLYFVDIWATMRENVPSDKIFDIRETRLI